MPSFESSRLGNRLSPSNPVLVTGFLDGGSLAGGDGTDTPSASACFLATLSGIVKGVVSS